MHRLPLLPLRDMVLFPHMIVPIFLTKKREKVAIHSALAQSKKILLSAVCAVDGQEVDRGMLQKVGQDLSVYKLGTVASVLRTRELRDGRLKVLVQGFQKAEITGTGLSEEGGHWLANVKWVEGSPGNIDRQSAGEKIRLAVEHVRNYAALKPSMTPDLVMLLEDMHAPGRVADLIAANIHIDTHDAQRVLGELSPLARLSLVNGLLVEMIRREQTLVSPLGGAKKRTAEGSLAPMGRCYSEDSAGDGLLGEHVHEDYVDLVKELRSKVLPEKVEEQLGKHLERLQRMLPESQEAGNLRHFIETVLSVPFQHESPKFRSLAEVENQLGSEHYGLEPVKERILEYLAVQRLNPHAKAPILCLYGPPGVGKTSLAKSVAKALGRPFVRLSLGGVRDESDVRGHRRTYVGAYPGRIAQALIQSKVTHPLILLDEVDKVSVEGRGDPMAALLEVLDPEQNHAFDDRFLGVPIDLSRVLFVATANHPERLGRPLLDRLELVEVGGYSEEDKVKIGSEYLWPKAVGEIGLTTEQLSLGGHALRTLVSEYGQGSGVRGLERAVAKVCRKIARQRVDENAGEASSMNHQRVSTPMIRKLLGPGQQSHLKNRLRSQVGLCYGLAFTTAGGELMECEVRLAESQAQRLVLTGTAGDVLRESAQTALNFVRTHSGDFGLSSKRFFNQDVHIHLPACAVPKDGPSAGLTMTVGLLSALLGFALPARLAMTGEMSLLGTLLPVGGIREKLLAARRFGCTSVILPKANHDDAKQVVGGMKEAPEIFYFENFFDAFAYIRSAAEFEPIVPPLAPAVLESLPTAS